MLPLPINAKTAMSGTAEQVKKIFDRRLKFTQERGTKHGVASCL
jgi:hypothetical protein